MRKNDSLLDQFQKLSKGIIAASVYILLYTYIFKYHPFSPTHKTILFPDWPILTSHPGDTLLSTLSASVGQRGTSLHECRVSFKHDKKVVETELRTPWVLEQALTAKYELEEVLLLIASMEMDAHTTDFYGQLVSLNASLDGIVNALNNARNSLQVASPMFDHIHKRNHFFEPGMCERGCKESMCF